MFTGSIAMDVITFLAIGYVGAFLLIPIVQWLDYKHDCHKYGKEQADEIWRRMR